jgi:hypothetical protein
MTKKYNQYTTEDTKCPEGDATRGKKKVRRGATRRRKQVQNVWITPCGNTAKEGITVQT